MGVLKYPHFILCNCQKYKNCQNLFKLLYNLCIKFFGKGGFILDLLTTGEVARRLGISINTVKNYESKGYLLPCKTLPSGRRYYNPEDVEKFLDSMKTKGGF